MADRLDRTVALVTGASSGIGQAAAEILATEGAMVILVARRVERLEAVAEDIRRSGGEATAVQADITDPDQVVALIDHVITKFGRLDTVVNAAGVMLNGDSIATPLADWDRMIDLNLRALVHVVKAALPHLLDATTTSSRSVADVVNISSIAGRWPAPLVAVYNASKFGVTAATESWRREFTARSLRFSVVEPGAVDTELFGHQQEMTQEHYQQMFADVEKLLAADVADAISFIVTSPRRVAINEIVIRPTDQI